jgi:hypothetical protein
MTVVDSTIVIAGRENPVLGDYVAHLRRTGVTHMALASTPDDCRAAAVASPAVVLFLDRHPQTDRPLIDAVAQLAANTRAARVCVVSSFLAHFGDHGASAVEAYAGERLSDVGVAAVVIRPSHVVSPHSRAAHTLRRLSGWFPLVPRRLRGCCLDSQDLFAAIEGVLNASAVRPGRRYTLLGPNRPWRDVLREQPGGGMARRAATAIATVLSWLFLGQFVGLAVAILGRVAPRFRAWNFDTLYPTSTAELLALYNPHNYHHVKIVGYNNGVVHFGQQHPGKTVVSTIRCNRVARVTGRTATFDGGVTIRQAVDVLSGAGKEFYVLPNYSFVSLGTAFFVPIHGSASEFSTLGDTIEKVLLYDPVADRFLAAARGESTFAEAMYDLGRDVLLLRLTLQVKDKSRYFLARETLTGPTSADLLVALRDVRPANVEIRKSKAASATADIYRYYTDGHANDGAALEFPRDRVGRLWDRIETNRVSAALFHGFMRRFGYHVEMFLSPDEFAAFWDTHGRLPIAKIQLRHIRRAAVPHAPFRDFDCVSADLFMLRKHKSAFEQYVRQTFPAVRFNPGKHSM